MYKNKSAPTLTRCSFIGDTVFIRGGMMDFKDLAIICANWLAGTKP